jgi:ankyrin repeat protein
MMTKAGASDLFAAVKKGDREAVERIAAADPSLLDEREGGATPLLTAYYYGHTDIAEMLRTKRPPGDIFEAATAGDVDRVRDFLRRDPGSADAYAPDGFHPLGLAAFFKRREVVRVLLEAGALPRRASRDQGFTPLHSAVATDAAAADIEIVRMLLAAGADPNAKSREGGTPLHTAAFIGDRAILDLLLAHGADTGVKTGDGKTPAEIAWSRGHTAIAERLGPR